MELGLNILIALICLWIIWDDFKNREIHTIAVAVLFLTIVLKRFTISSINIDAIFLNAGINTALLCVIFGVTYVFLKWGKRVENPSQTHLGIGDVLFFGALIFVGPPLDFVFLFVSLSILSLVVGLVGVLAFKWDNIPFAGISAIFFVILIVLEGFSITLESITNGF